MTITEHLVEQHIREYDSRLKHFDELMAQAQIDACKKAYAYSRLQKHLHPYRAEQQRFSTHVEELRLKSLENWRKEEIAMAGPMAVWDIIAQQLEGLVEKITHH